MPPAKRNAIAIPLGEDGIPTTVSNLCGSASPCEETNPVSTNPFAYGAWGNVLSETRGQTFYQTLFSSHGIPDPWISWGQEKRMPLWQWPMGNV